MRVQHLCIKTLPNNCIADAKCEIPKTFQQVIQYVTTDFVKVLQNQLSVAVI